jgi:hypothetical protein
MSKRALLIMILIVTTTIPAYASQVSFKDVKTYLEKTVQLHEPEDKSINSAAYDYPAINIVPLWQKLGVQFAPLKDKDDTYVFGCKPGQAECFLSYPQVDTIEHGDIKIIRITKSTPWDYQYLFFRRNGNEFLYFDHLEYDMQKYEEPDLVFLENDLLALKILSGTGTDTISYTTELIQITKDGAKKPLSFITRHERQGWGLCFDETVNSNYKYSKGILSINFDVTVKMNDNNYESKMKSKLSEQPIIHDKKRVVMVRKPEGFVLDKANSSTTIEDMEKLHWGGYSEFYEAFKNEFDALEKSNPKVREWFEFFKQEMADSKEPDKAEVSKMNNDSWSKLKKNLGGVTDDIVERYGNVDIAMPASEKEYIDLGGNAIAMIQAVAANRNELPLAKAYFQTPDGKQVMLSKLVMSSEDSTFSGNEITETKFADGKEKRFSNLSFWLVPVHLMLDDKAVLGVDFKENRESFIMLRGPWNIGAQNQEYLRKHSEGRIKFPERLDSNIVGDFIVREFAGEDK